jgi:hypothetical protein
MENTKQTHLDIIKSKPDIYGNSYVGMIVTRLSDNKQASGYISGGPSNCQIALKELTGGEWGNFTYTEKEIGIRNWNRMFKNAPYLGCTPEDINPKIIEQWNKEGK